MDRRSASVSTEIVELQVAAAGARDVVRVGPDLDQLRRLVPSERQQREGAELDTTALEASFAGADEAVEIPSRRARASVFLTSINPMGIEGRKLPLLVFTLSAFITGWDGVALIIVVPDIQAEFGLSVAALSAILAFTTTATTLMGLPLGYLIDRVKRVWLVRAGELLGCVGDVVQALAPSFGVMTVGRLLGTSVRLPESSAVAFPLLADYYPSRSRARVFGSLVFSGQVGALIAAPLVGIVVTLYGWREAFLALAVLSGVVTGLTFLLREPTRGAMDRREMGVPEELAEQEQSPPTFAEALRGAWSIRTLRLQAFAQFVNGFTAPLSLLLQLILATKFALDPFQRSLLLTSTTVVTLPSLALGAGIADRLLARKPSTLVAMLAGLSFIASASLIGQAFAPNLITFVILSIIPPVTTSLLLPASATVMSLVVPARYRGVGLQLGTPLRLISGLVAPALVAVATQISLQQAFIFFAPFMLLSGLFYLASAGTVSGDIRAARAAAIAGQESEQSRRDRQNKILVCRDVDVAIDEVQILFKVDLDVREGEIVALVGTNGAGKSTLLRAICGLQQATNGAIFFDGRDITHLPTHQSARLGVVYMPGGQGVFPLMTVRDNLTSAAWMGRNDPTSVEADMQRVLDLFPRLRERHHVLAGSMSGGEQQMLALGQAFLMKPRLLMIDELSLGLAPAVVEQLLDAIRVMKSEGMTVVLVEQSLNVALTIADRAVFMDKGEVRFDGPTEELLARPDLVRAVFMGGGAAGGATGLRKRTVSVEDRHEPLLRCEQLDVAFGGVQALCDVSLTVAAGEVVGIIGPNGAGKTTLFDVLSGFTPSDGGRVRIGEADVTKLSPDARARLGLGRAFQNARLFPPLTVRENIAVALEKRANRSPLLGAVWAPSVRNSERKLTSRVDGFIELLGLTQYADKFIRELSTGTRRAVEVACQMAAEPRVLLLDEPSSGLAQAETEALGPALLRIVKETGCGMLVIEHDLPLITSISDRLIAMELGAVVTTGTPYDVTHDPRVLASYLAASSDVIDRSGSRVGSVLSTITTNPAQPFV
jgi:ABC-type branched-subunit amino acid transport system ATPase component/MFS family permease